MSSIWSTQKSTLGRFVRLARRADGQSLIETAIVFPVLVILLMGAADLARIGRASVDLSNAAKAGAQYGTQNGFTAQDTTGIATAAQNEVKSLTVTTSSSYTCVCSDGTSSTCQNTDCSSSHVIETLTVNTQATVTPLIHLPVLPTTFTVKGKAVQRCLQ